LTHPERIKEQRKHRGGERPEGALTLEEASTFQGLRSRNHMAIRRALEPARVGRWLPTGARHWRVLYNATAVEEIATAFKEGRENPYRPRPTYGPPPSRPRSKVPCGPREGWATSDRIQAELKKHGIALYECERWLRNRLVALDVPSERVLVGNVIRRAFPLAAAIAQLKYDDFVIARVRGYRVWPRSRRTRPG
jgi:hypothetical protein